MTPEWIAARARSSEGDPEPWRQLRLAAADRLLASGFPSTRDEAWKYTKAAPYQSGAYAPETPGVPVVGSALDLTAMPLGAGPRIVFVDGWFDPIRSEPPSGVSVRSVREVDQVVGRLYPEPQGFVAANLALARDGVLLHLGAERAAHVEILHVTTGSQRLSAVRHVIEVEAGARLELVERFVGGGQGFSSAVLEVLLAPGAELVHLREQDEHPTHLHHAALAVQLREGARYQLASLLLGGATTRVEIDVRLVGEGATAELAGLAAQRGSQHADHHVTITHQSPGCASRQLFRSLLDDRAHGIFTGKVVVAKGAQKTDAVQHHRALLLSDDALAHVRPQLEIDADDVKCAHGAAVGSLDEEALFYLRQRGLDPRQARALLTAAFAQDVISTVPFAPERERLEARLERWLEGA